MTELHLADRYERRCLWCGEDTVGITVEQDRDVWKAAWNSCRVSRPVTLAIFDRNEGQFSQQGFDDDAIKITDDLLARRIERLTPLVSHEGTIYRIEQPDLRRTAFTWEPKRTTAVVVREVAVSPTFHGCGYYGFFKPSIAEVLAQLPDGIEANGFYIDDDILVCQQGDGHLAKTHWVQIEEG